MAGRRGDRDTEQLRKLFIGGLSYETSDDGLRTFYEKWGEVVDCVVMRDPATKRSRGFGFITYSSMDMVDDALNGRPHIIDGKEVEPKRATPRDETGPSENRIQVKKVFVGGIGQDTDENHLREYFSKFGSIESTAIVTDKETGKNRGFGFVVFEDYEPVDKLCAVRMHEVNGHRCEVKKAIPRGDESLAKSAKSTRPGGRSGYGGGGGGGGGRMSGGYGGGSGGYGGGSGGYGGGGYAGYGGGYGDAYGGYGGAGGWNQPDGGYGAGGYGANNFGSGYGSGYAGGAMKSASYAAKAPGPYGGGYGSSAGGAGGGYGASSYSGGGGAGAGAAYGGAAYGTGASTGAAGGYPNAGGYPGYGAGGY